MLDLQHLYLELAINENKCKYFAFTNKAPSTKFIAKDLR